MARLLLIRGIDREEISQQTGIPVKTLNRMHGWIRSPSGKAWIDKNQKLVFPEGLPSALNNPLTKGAEVPAGSGSLSALGGSGLAALGRTDSERASQRAS